MSCVMVARSPFSSHWTLSLSFPGKRQRERKRERERDRERDREGEREKYVVFPRTEERMADRYTNLLAKLVK